MARTEVDSPRQLITIGIVFGVLGIGCFILFRNDLSGTGPRHIPMWAVSGTMVLIGIIGVSAGLKKHLRSKR